jgi:hypothetical protein
MELSKNDFLSILGLRHKSDWNELRQVPTSSITSSSKFKQKSKQYKGKFKFSSFVCSFPITIVNENSYLSRKFYKEFKHPNANELFEYEKFCLTRNIFSKTKQSNSLLNKKENLGNLFLFNNHSNLK